MSGSRRGANPLFSHTASPVTAIGDTITLAEIETVKTHCFAGVQFFSDAAGLVPAVPTTGQVAISIKTINSLIFEPAPGGIIPANLPSTISWAANTMEVRVIPSGIDVATHYKLVVTCNEA